MIMKSKNFHCIMKKDPLFSTIPAKMFPLLLSLLFILFNLPKYCFMLPILNLDLLRARDQFCTTKVVSTSVPRLFFIVLKTKFVKSKKILCFFKEIWAKKAKGGSNQVTEVASTLVLRLFTK